VEVDPSSSLILFPSTNRVNNCPQGSVQEIKVDPFSLNTLSAMFIGYYISKRPDVKEQKRKLDKRK